MTAVGVADLSRSNADSVPALSPHHVQTPVSIYKEVAPDLKACSPQNDQPPLSFTLHTLLTTFQKYYSALFPFYSLFLTRALTWTTTRRMTTVAASLGLSRMGYGAMQLTVCGISVKGLLQSWELVLM